MRAAVWVDGTTGPQRLSHPECVAVAADGAVWCGGDRGELYRIDPDGSGFEQVASTGGFVLGIAFDGDGRLYACDLALGAVFRWDGERLERIADGIRVPNFPVVDARRNCVYVSDSHDAEQAGPGIWRIDLDGGECALWYADDLVFANGMALAPGGDALYVVETWAQRVVEVPIGADGSPGEPSVVVDGIERVPDGIAVDARGRLYIACYEPSRIYRYERGGALEVLIDDPTAHLLCHPTNCAFRGRELFIANLGRWHVTRMEVDAPGLDPLS